MDRPDQDKPNPRAVRGAGAGFSGSRLKQLQLARSRVAAQSMPTTTTRSTSMPVPVPMDVETAKQDALRRWQSMSMNMNSDDKEDDPLRSFSSASLNNLGDAASRTCSARRMNYTYSTPRAVAIQSCSSGSKHNNSNSINSSAGPVVYVLPDPNDSPRYSKNGLLWNRHQRNSSSSSSTSSIHTNTNTNTNTGLSAAADTAPHLRMKEDLKLKYPHGMPRWGPRLVTAASPTTLFDNNNDNSNDSNDVSDNDNDKDPMRDYISNIGGYSLPRRELHYNNSNNNSNKSNSNDGYDDASFASVNKEERKMPAKSRQETVVEKAKRQSLLAAARAAQKVVGTTNYAPLNKNRTTRTTTMHRNANNKEGNNTSNNSNNKHRSKRVGLGARLLGRPQTLLQSARLQQFRVIHASDQLIHQTISLDELRLRRTKPVHHDDNDADDDDDTNTGADADIMINHGLRVARSVQSFEFFHRSTHHTTTHADRHSDSEHSQVRDKQQTSDEDDDDDKNSWDMDSNDSSESVDVGGSNVFQQSSASSESESMPPDVFYGGAQGSSAPTLIPSEIDHESSSLYSDYSSIVVSSRRGDDPDDNGPEEGQEEEFYDSIGSIRASPTTEEERERRFDARRCQELLDARSIYLAQEERKKLISPKVVQRLTNTPPLSRVADGAALRELASRGRWHLSRQRHEYKVRIPSASPQPLASLPDADFEAKPISLIAPSMMMTTPAIIYKNVWHKPAAEAAQQEENKDGNNYTEDLAEDCNKGDTANRKHPSRIRQLSIRYIPSLLIMFWAGRTYNRLHGLFIQQALSLGINIHDKTTPQLTAWKPPLYNSYATFMNLSCGTSFPGTTVLEINFPLKNTLPKNGVRSTNIQHRSHSLQCNSDEIESKFWDIVRDIVGKADIVPMDGLEADMPQITLHGETLESAFLFDMSHDQTLCDVASDICVQSSSLTSLEADETEQKKEKTYNSDNEVESDQAYMSMALGAYISGHDTSMDSSPLKKSVLALQKTLSQIDDKEANLWVKIGDVLRGGSQNIKNMDHLNQSDNTLFHKLASVMQQSSQNLQGVDPFNDFYDRFSEKDHLLDKFVAVLRRPSQNLQAKRRRRLAVTLDRAFTR